MAAGATVPADAGEVSVTVRHWDAGGPAAPGARQRRRLRHGARVALEASTGRAGAPPAAAGVLSHPRLAPDGVLCEVDVVMLVERAAHGEKAHQCKPEPFDGAELELSESGSVEDATSFGVDDPYACLSGMRVGRSPRASAPNGGGAGAEVHTSCASSSSVSDRGQELVVHLYHQRTGHPSMHSPRREEGPPDQALLVKAAVMAGAVPPMRTCSCSHATRSSSGGRRPGRGSARPDPG